MADQRAYSPKDLRRAVNLAAFLGWSFFAGFISLETFNPLILPWVALFGLPIAFGCAWLIGAPLLWRMMKRPITWTQAALGGGAITAAIAALSIGVGRFMGWRQSQNEAFSSRLGGDGYIRSVDGILTPYGCLLYTSPSPRD